MLNQNLTEKQVERLEDIGAYGPVSPKKEDKALYQLGFIELYDQTSCYWLSQLGEEIVDDISNLRTSHIEGKE